MRAVEAERFWTEGGREVWNTVRRSGPKHRKGGLGGTRWDLDPASLRFWRLGLMKRDDDLGGEGSGWVRVRGPGWCGSVEWA